MNLAFDMISVHINGQIAFITKVDQVGVSAFDQISFNINGHIAIMSKVHQVALSAKNDQTWGIFP